MKFFISIFFLLIPFSLFAESIRNVKLDRVVDGDTIVVSIEGVPEVFGQNIYVRLAGVDTPEMKGRCENERVQAVAARDKLLEVLKDAKKINLLNVKRGKYFRIVADVYTDKHNLSQVLLESGLAREYERGPKHNWCRYRQIKK